MAATHTCIELDLCLASEPISGTMRRAGEQPRPFTGWLELAALLERARETTPADRQQPITLDGSA